MRSGIASYAFLLALVLIICWPLFETRPFENVNMYILWWADHAHPSDLLRVDPDVYPEWRPLSYATLWLQYQWAGLDRLWSYYAVNLLIWAGCGWMAYRVVLALVNSVAGGLTAAVLVLTSTQLIGSLVLIMERQSFFASLFGLAAWLIVVGVEDKPKPTWLEWTSLFLLLEAAALSKEYGLAFVGATAVYGIYRGQSHVAVAATVAALVYGGLRAVFAGGAVTVICRESGYFLGARDVCLDRFAVVTVSQVTYNVVAAGLASLLPGVLFEDGRITLSPRWLFTSVLLLGVAIAGWRKGPRANRMGLLIVMINTLLNFGVYRSRNHLPALCAVAVSVGVGLPIVIDQTRRLSTSRLVPIGLGLVMLSVLSMRVMVTRQLVFDRDQMSSRSDPCSPDMADLDRDYMQQIWQRYGLTLPECTGR